VVMTVLAQQVSDRMSSHRSNSSGNLKQMGLALLGYSGDYGGYFPTAEGVAGFNRIILTNDLPNGKVYINPRDVRRVASFDPKSKWLKNKTCSYAYVGSGLRDDNADSTTVPVIWEKPTGDTWCSVLFIDGHVSGVGGKFNTNVDVVKALKKKLGFDDQRYNFFLKKARKMDDAEGIPIEKLPKEMVKAIDALIAQLGAEGFKTRKKAQAGLKKYMPKSYKYLKQQMDKADDPEVKSRLKAVLYE
jgi:hypothetical protein